MTVEDSAAVAEAVAAARDQLAEAEQRLGEAQVAFKHAQAMREDAEQIADRLTQDAPEARADADEVMRAYLAAAQGGMDFSSLQAAVSAGNDLLAGLGGIERVQHVTNNASALHAAATEHDEQARAVEAAAEEATVDAQSIPLDQHEDAVTTAERAVTTARAKLAELTGSSTASPGGSRDRGQLSTQGWAHPVRGQVTDGYGPRPVKPVPGVGDFHRGTDLSAACGTPVYAATAGVVVEAGANGTYGNWVLIDHGDGITTGYAHLDEGGIYVQVQQAVAAGETIGAVGTTGASTGCHLHFEIRINGHATDPIPFMAARGITLG